MASSKVVTLNGSRVGQCTDEVYLLDSNTTTNAPDNITSLVDANGEEEIQNETMDPNEEESLTVLYFSHQEDEYHGDLDSLSETQSTGSACSIETESSTHETATPTYDVMYVSAYNEPRIEGHPGVVFVDLQEMGIYASNVFVGQDYEIQYDSNTITDSYEIFSGINIGEGVISFNLCSSEDQSEEYGDFEELDNDEERGSEANPNGAVADC